LHNAGVDLPGLGFPAGCLVGRSTCVSTHSP
jgi:hypothetical protein